MRRNTRIYILFILMVCLIFNSKNNVKAYSPEIDLDIKNTNKFNILVDLEENKLYVINKNNNNIENKYAIAGGKEGTPSPIGTWTIISKGEWSGGFGTRWMGMDVPWGKYGIHGTNKPYTIGGAASLGCIRMYNKDVEELYKKISYGTTVVIYGGPYDMHSNRFRVLIPGDRGADVFEVQRIMKEKGYYSNVLDGIYGEELKKEVIKFRKDNKLPITHNIDTKFTEKLGIQPFE